MASEKTQYHLRPFIKWAGGKDKELKILQKYFPENISRYVEPFVGGGAAYLNTPAKEYLINDKSVELISLYEMIQNNNPIFFGYITQIAHSWNRLTLFSRDNKNNLIRIFNEYDEDRIKDFIQKNIKEIEKLTIRNENDIEILTKEITRNLNSKIKRAKKIASSKGMLPEDEIIKNMECALKSAFYMYIRYLYNSIPLDVHKELYCATFYFIREYCYSSMFRYNDKGEFNVPYGGISYNNKDFLNKINLLTSNELIQKLNNNTFISCNDFEVFLEAINLTKNDFIFLDPPYDTEFSTYAKNSFDRKDQIRLAEYLKKTNAKFLLVIKETDFIKSLYSDFTILSFEKQYMVSFKNRNKRDVTHLIIKNY